MNYIIPNRVLISTTKVMVHDHNVMQGMLINYHHKQYYNWYNYLPQFIVAYMIISTNINRYELLIEH